MKVSELADEFEIPASAVLAQCRRFGIDATWAGAELSGADVVVLRSELGGSAPIDLTLADPPDPNADPEPAGEPAIRSGGDAPVPDAPTVPQPAGDAGDAGAGGGLPPTAVGSMPDLIDEVTPDSEPPEAVLTDRSSLAPGFGRPGAATAAAATRSGPDARRTTVPAKPRFERSVRSSIAALCLAAIAYIGSNYVNLPILVVVLWLAAAVALVVAFVDSLRGRRHATTHPDRYRGTVVATITMVLSVAGIVAMTASVFAVITEDPDDAPAELADLQSVQVARWGYQRMMRLQENGWHQPTRSVGSCWRKYEKRKDRDQQRVEAVEVNLEDSCTQKHTHEVLDVFAYNREADSPYPGSDGFTRAGLRECGERFEEIAAEHPEAVLQFEYPDAAGWDDGDHDVACVMVTPERTSSLTG